MIALLTILSLLQRKGILWKSAQFMVWTVCSMDVHVIIHLMSTDSRTSHVVSAGRMWDTLGEILSGGTVVHVCLFLCACVHSYCLAHVFMHMCHDRP